MSRRAALVGLAGGVLLGGCGGSVACGPRLISVYSDSVHHGGYGATPTATVRSYLDTRPSARLAELTGAQVMDHAIPGWTCLEWAQGWASTVATDPAGTIVLRLGGADAVAGTPVEAVEQTVGMMARTALDAARRVVIVGLIRTVRKPAWQDPIGISAAALAGIELRALANDAALRRVAGSLGVPFADTRAVPMYGPEDIADAVHPAQSYSDRCVAVVAVLA